MTITRWEAYRDVVALQNRMNSLFQDFSRNGSGENEPVTAAGFVPPVDIYEDEHKLVLKLEIPGIRQEDLDVRMENSTLSVRGERSFRDGRQGRELPSCGAALRQLLSCLHGPQHHRPGKHQGRIRRWGSAFGTAEASGKQAQANQGERRISQAAEPESTGSTRDCQDGVTQSLRLSSPRPFIRGELTNFWR